jgi:hypothetical protein
LNVIRFYGIYIGVRSLRTMLTVLLAVAWLPLTAHCQLEGIAGLEVLQCSSVTAVPSSDSHSDDTSCCGWEFSEYRLPQSQPPVSAPLSVMVLAVLVTVDCDLPAEVSAGIPTAAPSGSPKPWQFSLRAALPVRAPSIAS